MKGNLTQAEIGYNLGVGDVLALARASAKAIGENGTRHIPEGFAIAALTELAEAGKGLLIKYNSEGAGVTGTTPAGSASTAEAVAVK